MRRNVWRAGVVGAFGVAAALAQQGGPIEPNATRDERGVLIHRAASSTQRSQTKVRVLLPSDPKPGERFRVLYVLPVEALDEQRWGDALGDILRLGLHDRFRLICVSPTFYDLPWYADHPTDSRLRQEEYFVDEVVPFIDRIYPTVQGGEGRFLLGFSKSGWGAWSLLLRHPDSFGRAAAWDAPLDKRRPDEFGMEPIFGTQKNFERYQVTELLTQRAELLRRRTRLVLTGYDNFREHHEAIHQRLLELEIPHVYRDGPRRAHHWESGWFAEAVELLAGR